MWMGSTHKTLHMVHAAAQSLFILPTTWVPYASLHDACCCTISYCSPLGLGPYALLHDTCCCTISFHSPHFLQPLSASWLMYRTCPPLPCSRAPLLLSSLSVPLTRSILFPTLTAQPRSLLSCPPACLCCSSTAPRGLRCGLGDRETLIPWTRSLLMIFLKSCSHYVVLPRI